MMTENDERESGLKTHSFFDDVICERPLTNGHEYLICGFTHEFDDGWWLGVTLQFGNSLLF